MQPASRSAGAAPVERPRPNPDAPFKVPGRQQADASAGPSSFTESLPSSARSPSPYTPSAREPLAPASTRDRQSPASARDRLTPASAREPFAPTSARDRPTPASARAPFAPSTPRELHEPSAPATPRELREPSAPATPPERREPSAPATPREQRVPSAPATPREPATPAALREPAAPATPREHAVPTAPREHAAPSNAREAAAPVSARERQNIEPPAPPRRSERPTVPDSDASASEVALSQSQKLVTQPPPAEAPKLVASEQPPVVEAPKAVDVAPVPVTAPVSAAAGRTASPTSALEAQDPRHQKARRLARLLVGEIKLYNEEGVVEGRRKGDLYGRLKEAIDLSLENYRQRVPEEVRTAFDYLYDELLRQLAEGDPLKLGPGAPKPNPPR